MKQKPVVGQILYDLNVGNAARNTEQKLTPVVVKKVGRKYFTCGVADCSEHMNTQYYLETWRENTIYSSEHSLYSSEQELINEKEERQLCKKIEAAFHYGHNTKKISLIHLRNINQIIQGAGK